MRNKMKKFVLGLALVFASALSAPAETVYGKITSLGTLPEENAGGFNAFARVRLSASNCTGDSTPKIRYIHIRSGRMESPWVHNATNFQAAYNTLRDAFQMRKTVEIQGVPNCNASEIQTINLWESAVSVLF